MTHSGGDPGHVWPGTQSQGSHAGPRSAPAQIKASGATVRPLDWKRADHAGRASAALRDCLRVTERLRWNSLRVTERAA